MTLTGRNVANAGGSYQVAKFSVGAPNAVKDIQAMCLVDSSGNEIPVSVNALSAYAISDLDEATSTKYYGNLDADGNWYILKLTSTAARYTAGTSDYATNWTNRASLTYDYYNAVF